MGISQVLDELRLASKVDCVQASFIVVLFLSLCLLQAIDQALTSRSILIKS